MTPDPPHPVKIISSHTLHQSHPPPTTTTPFLLGPLDFLVAPSIPIAVLFLYSPPASNPELQIIDPTRLKSAAERLLDAYPHLTGRLRVNESDGTPEIWDLGTGGELVLAECDRRLDSFPPNPLPANNHSILPFLPDEGNAFFPPLPPDLPSTPLLVIQHTRFSCGSVALGIRVPHVVCDAEGYFQLVGDLAELYRTGGRLGREPVVESYGRDWVWMSEEEKVVARGYKPELMYIEPTPPSSTMDPQPPVPPPPTPPPITGRFILFHPPLLSHLKKTASTPSHPVSTFTALSAHLHRRVYLARSQYLADHPGEPLSPPDFLTPVNLRSRLPELGGRYFPQALATTYTSFPPHLLSGPLPPIAQQVHGMTHHPALSPPELHATLHWLSAQPSKSLVRSGFRYGSGSLMLSQWNKMDIYASTAFEVEPGEVGPPFTGVSRMDGLGYLLPLPKKRDGEEGGEGGVGGVGGVVVALALGEGVWEYFERLGEEGVV